MVQDIEIDNYDYPLPDSRIARYPLAVRDSCKLLCYSAADGTICDRVFTDLPSVLPANTRLVCNDTKVINARLRFRKGTDGSGALVEIFCLEPACPADYERSFASTGACAWTCLVGNSKRWTRGCLSQRVDTSKGRCMLTAERGEPAGEGSWKIHFSWDNPSLTFSDIIAAVGEIPIPPYLQRGTEASDSSDYQMVYSHIEGSVAAPTAGLHFTPALLKTLGDRGVDIREVTLHVGAGTFRPVKSRDIGHHDMHSELCAVPRGLIVDLARDPRPVTAVGTTSVRTLESLYHSGCMLHQGCWQDEVEQWYPYAENHPNLTVAQAMEAVLEHIDAEGSPAFVFPTRLIIAPGYRYRIVEGMVTNFHQPRSTLLLLVSAFIGEAWRDVYRHALAGDYRFLSYGDACYFTRNR